MTLGEGKDKVLKLLDEYSSGGQLTPDDDINLKMNDFFDTAQKQVSAVKPIRKLTTITRVSGQTAYDMPADFRKLCCIYRGGRRTQRYDWIGGKLIIPEGETETVQIEYFAYPQTITAETPDSYVFEVAEDAAQACPFFVASQQLISDLVLDYTALRAEWANALAMLTPDVPGGVQLRQVLFSGR